MTALISSSYKISEQNKKKPRMQNLHNEVYYPYLNAG